MTGNRLIKTDGLIYECHICGTKLAENRFLHHHIQVNHADVWKSMHECNQCDMKFISTKSQESHMKTAHRSGNIQYKCQHCDGIKFSTKHGLGKHMKAFHEDIWTSLHECNKCGVKCSSTTSMEAHLRSVHSLELNLSLFSFSIHEKILHPCALWEFKATCKFDLRTHRKQFHENYYHDYYKQKIVCSVCTRSLNRSSISQHMKSVHLNKKYSCDVCSNTFAQITSLTRHKRSTHNLLNC